MIVLCFRNKIWIITDKRKQDYDYRYIHDIKRWAMYSYYFRVSQYWHVMPCEGTARKAQSLALLDVHYEVADDPWFVHSLL